ncbi:MAG: restriction endonuclease [Methanobacteriaceae archaeon]
MKALEKKRLVDFVAKIMEQSGFKVHKNYRTSKYIIDVYGLLPTVLGDIGVVVACKNYEERWKVGMDVLKELEMTAKALQASKIVIITTSDFSPNAVSYAERRGIQLIDKDGLMALAEKFSQKTETIEDVDEYAEEDYVPSKAIGTSFVGKGKRISLSGRRQSEASNKLKAWCRAILRSTVGLIIIVLAVSTLITYFISLNPALLGILRIFFAAILSYGIVFALERDLIVTLVKGTTVFFVTLIIYIVLILLR